MDIAIRADRLPFKRNGCRKCGCKDGHLGRYIQYTGQQRCRWVCDNCGDYFTAGDLPHAWLKSQGVYVEDDLPICRDRRGEVRHVEFCAVCAKPAQHQHHWAPRSIFPDWPYELMLPLCEPHHVEWHSTMREHGLRYPHELAVALIDDEW